MIAMLSEITSDDIRMCNDEQDTRFVEIHIPDVIAEHYKPIFDKHDYDGYPIAHGSDIAMALLNAALTERKKYTRFDGKKCDESVLNNRNWCQHFLKELCKQDMDIEFVNADAKLYSDFTYVITGEYDNFGGKFDIDKIDYLNRINVKVYDGDEQGELLFDGSGLEYLNWKHWE